MLIILMHLLGSNVKLAISTVLFYFSSVIIVGYIAFGPLLTKQLLIALLQNFLLTVLVAITVSNKLAFAEI
jgi:hypothetical protein